MLKNKIFTDGFEIEFTLHETSSHKDFDKFTQSYGFCFTKEGKLVIGKKDNHWNLPGGTIEKDETPEDALVRELDEELSLKVLDFKMLGVQNVEFINKPDPNFGWKFNQLRFFCLVELKELTPDPDNNILWERKLINPDDFLKYIPWGNIGARLIELAKKEFEKIK